MRAPPSPFRKGMFMSVPSPASLCAADKQQLLLNAFRPKARMVNYCGVRGKFLWNAVCGMLASALAGLCLYLWLPDIVSDARLAWFDAVVVEPQAELSGSCKIMKMIYIACDAKISYRPDPARDAVSTVEQHTSFFGFSHGSTIAVLRSTTHPHRITTSIALEHLGKRIFSFLLLTGLSALAAYAICNEAWHAFRQRRLQGKSAVLRPVLAMIDACDEDRQVKFTADVDGVARHGENVLRYGDCPVVLPWKTNLTIALLASGTGYMILLDADLSVAEFNADEKALLQTLLR